MLWPWPCSALLDSSITESPGRANSKYERESAHKCVYCVSVHYIEFFSPPLLPSLLLIVEVSRHKKDELPACRLVCPTIRSARDIGDNELFPLAFAAFSRSCTSEKEREGGRRGEKEGEGG